MVYDFVFVVLVYRNTRDLKEFFCNLTLPNAKVVVVNSFFDDMSERAFKDIANDNGADFISVPNKGYGAGNNRGCEYAINHYKFRYLIISNADIEVKKMDIMNLEPFSNGIVAPKTLTLAGKNQNPFMVRQHPCFDKIKNWAYRNSFHKVTFLFSIISRLEREIFLKILYPIFHNNRIYAAHGAFVIIPYKILLGLCPIYNEKMFLFVEEEHLGKLAKKNNIPIFYNPKIIISHKEDGSTGALDNSYKYVRDSFQIFYKYWYH